MIYQPCCEQTARQEPMQDRCPHCQLVLVRCERCQGLCDEDSWCVGCYEFVSLVDVGTRFVPGDAVAVSLRFAHQGQRHWLLHTVRYGLNCGEGFTHEKKVGRALPPGEVTTLLLDGLVAPAGHLALQAELVLEADGQEFRFRGEALLDRARAVVEAARQVNIQIDHVDKAADVNIQIGGQEGQPIGAGDEPRWVEFPWSKAISVGPVGMTRRTPILFPDAESGEPRVHYLARRNGLRFGVARPEKFAGVDVCMRLYPQHDGLQREANELMSRSHFTLTARNGELCLVDHSTNGTTVNLTTVPREHPQVLHDGDVVAPYTDPRLIRHRRFVVRLLQGSRGLERVEWNVLGGS